MKTLNTPVTNLTFEDISEFCKEKYIEGVQIDYKQDFPQKGLSKHFAAFSNTRGGIIIIGVEEDNKTGSPIKWEGIKNDGKLIDRVHQFASNLEPIPTYEVAITNDNNGKVFLLIRIYEGNKTPYYVQNDSNIWIRTGNISNPIDIASPDALELLFHKREKAEMARAFFINRAHEIYSAALKRADNERKSLIASEKKDFLKKQEEDGITNPSMDNFESRIYKESLGTQTAMCTILLQPYYPHKSYIKPSELKDSIEQIRARGKYEGDFPSFNKETIPEGIMSFNWNQNSGSLSCEQLYGYGFVYNSEDVLLCEKDGKKVYLSQIARQIYISLLATAKYYKYIGYEGNIIGYILINGIEDASIIRIVPHGWTGHFFENERFLLNKYRWDLDTDTSILNSPQELQKLFIELMDEIYVSLNYAHPQENLLKAFLKDEGWLVE